MTERYDLIVIGTGPGGYVAGIRAAQLGKKVACVDRRAVPGGTCLNVGCIPSKALLDSSELYAQAEKGLSRHGIQVGEIHLDLPKLLARKDDIVKGLTRGITHLFKKNRITFVTGTARIERAPQGERGRVRVLRAEEEDLHLEAETILLATGSEPAELPSLPFDGSSIVTSTEALTFARVPEHFLVVGGGYIGLELGSVWARLGAKVTVVEFLPRILPTSDAEMSEHLRKILDEQGLTFHLDTRVTGASTQGGQVLVNARHKGKDVLFQGDKVLVAVGRRPCTRGLSLADVGVDINEETGRIPVDENYQTNIPGIYAIGDLTAGPMLAHKASEEGIAFAERLVGMKTSVNLETIPGVIYTWPELASVGATEEQLQASGREYRKGKFSFSASGRARCLDETQGLVKVLADARTDRVLGVHILGPRASELIAEAVTVMEYSGSAEDIARICHAHPTLSEAVREAALAVAGRAIHS
jgi:dihydrolipoamide dehydrogenase